jgi:hypothetical protein
MQQIYEREGHSRRASVRACWGGLFVFAERVRSSRVVAQMVCLPPDCRLVP